MTEPQDTKQDSGATASHSWSLVGIGASAGGLAALREFFKQMPAEPGLPFVVVMHLSPDYESHLTEVLQPHCSMPVTQVAETVALEPNHVYVIPPNANLDSVDTHLRLSQLEPRPKLRTPIDHFFRTMTASHDGNCVGVVLSGTGSDGTLGLRRIKEAGGLTMVQDPEQADYDGMPRNAMTDGMVDLVLPVGDMPGHILRFANTRPKVDIPEQEPETAEDQGRTLQKIFAQVRARTGHDFSRYKRTTILRRLQRRMQLHQVETLDAYLELMRNDRDEVKKLFDDMLITVTEFFRDKEVFDHLQKHVIPQLFEGKSEQNRLRVWSVGCSTGEEAYSLAMLLVEEADRRDDAPTPQVFSTDLHEPSLTRARAGVYPDSIASDVSAERLQRFFIKENGSYRVKQELRELIVFAPHNLLKDPPFSHLDLIVCRNLMIYLQRDLQEDVAALFHYALEPSGLLVLGTSETTTPSGLFASEDSGFGVYRRLGVPSRDPHLPVFPFTPARNQKNSNHDDDEPNGQAPMNVKGYGELHSRMVEWYAPPSILLSRDHEVVHYSAHAGRYLQIPGGEPTHNVFKLIVEPLRIELRSALHLAEQDGEVVHSKPVLLLAGGERRQVVLRVRAATDSEMSGFYLVIFDEYPVDDGDTQPPATPKSGTVAELEAELELTRKRLQTVVDQYETGQEEMQASNEELQSTNEELRSTLEELETSKEELQSMNEELTTVNQENRHRVDELSQITSDLENLLAATDIATLFLDRELRITWFSPQLGELFNIRQTDKGRPLSDLTHRLTGAPFHEDAQAVLETVEPIEREVSSNAGHCYLVRVLPYRGEHESVDGVVITLIDITDRKRVEQQLRQAHDDLEKRVAERTAQLEDQKVRLQHLARELAAAENRERKRLAAMLHDELQQYLVALKMHLNVLQQKAESQDIRDAVSKSIALADDAMRSSRNLTHELRPPVLYEDGLVPALQWLCRQMAEQHEMQVSLETGDYNTSLDEDIRAMLFESVRELLLNIIKHAGVYRAEVTLAQADEQLSITVCDAGEGFDVQAAGHKKSGSGLGLFSIRERLETVGGDMSIRSAPGEGTAITMQMPMAIAADSGAPGKLELLHEPAASTAPHVEKQDDSSVPSVLVADDNAIVRQGLIMLLADEGKVHVVGEAADGVEAVRAVERLRPDVVLIDVNMPKLNGIEATRQIRERWPAVRVIGLSVQDDDATAQSMREAGADAFVSKNDDAQGMLRTILEAGLPD